MTDYNKSGGIQMYKKDCFVYKEKDGKKICTALNNISCNGCKFYKTKDYYIKYVEPLEHKGSGGV